MSVTASEINGWYSFGFALDGYLILGLSIFYPIIMESLVAHNAVDTITKLPCRVDMPGYDCSVHVAGFFLPTTTLVFFATSFAVLLQFTCAISFSAYADYGSYRKKFALIFGLSTTLIAMTIILVVKYQYWWVSFLVYIFSSVTCSTSFIFATSYLPILTRNHPKVLDAKTLPPKERSLVTEKVANELTAKLGIYGACPAIIQLILAIAFVYFVNNSFWTARHFPETYGLQIAVAATAVWAFLILFYYTRLNLSDRSGPELPDSKNPIAFSWTKTFDTLRNASRLPQLFKFLVAWFFFSDGFNTIISTALLFAQVQLNASQTVLLLTGLSVPIASVIGVAISTWLQAKFKVSTKHALLIEGFLYSLFPIYGLFFLHSTSELIPLGIYNGLIFGSVLSTSKVLYSELLPPGSESEFFGLFSLTDKGSAWIGPLVVGAIRNWTGNLRPAFYFILIQLFVPTILFFWVDVEQGRLDAKGLAIALDVENENVKENV